MLVAESAPPAMVPWTTFGAAAICLGAAFLLVRVVKSAYDRDSRASRRPAPRPAWWRIRVLGWHEMTVVPLTFGIASFGLAMAAFSLYLWTELAGLWVIGLAFVGTGLCSFVWWLYDSLGPRAWRDRSDEYRI